MPRLEIGERAVADVGRAQTAGARSLDERRAATAISPSARRSASWMTGTTSAVVDRDGESRRSLGRRAGRASVAPARVHAADDGAATRRDELHEQIGDVDASPPGLREPPRASSAGASRRPRAEGGSAAPTASSRSSAPPSPPERADGGGCAGHARRDRRRRSRHPVPLPCDAPPGRRRGSAARRRAFGEASGRSGTAAVTDQLATDASSDSPAREDTRRSPRPTGTSSPSAAQMPASVPSQAPRSRPSPCRSRSRAAARRARRRRPRPAASARPCPCPAPSRARA